MTCPYVQTSDEGTSHCGLAEADVAAARAETVRTLIDAGVLVPVRTTCPGQCGDRAPGLYRLAPGIEIEHGGGNAR